jgi:hypothetical protein
MTEQRVARDDHGGQKIFIMGKGFRAEREQGAARHQTSIAKDRMASAGHTEKTMTSLNLCKDQRCHRDAFFTGKQGQCTRKEKKLRSDRVPHIKRARQWP